MKKSKRTKKSKFSTVELEKLIETLQSTSETLAIMLHVKLAEEEKQKEISKEKEFKNRLKTLSKDEIKAELAEVVANCFDYETKEFRKTLKSYRKAIKFSKNLEIANVEIPEVAEVSEVEN